MEDSTGASWVWTRNHFLNRKFAMVEMFNARMEDDPDWDRPIETVSRCNIALLNFLTILMCNEIY